MLGLKIKHTAIFSYVLTLYIILNKEYQLGQRLLYVRISEMDGNLSQKSTF